jgi:type IV secretory pathway VirB2 component (pilin)
MKKTIFLLAVLALMLAPAAFAADCAEDDFACRIGNVTNLVSIIGGALAVLALTVVGVMMFNAKDPSERDQLKDRLKYIIIGLVVIVLAPQVVKYLLNI